MRKAICFLLAVFTGCAVRSQELYVFSEPASNIPSRSLSTKLNYRLPASTWQMFRQRYTSETMLGGEHVLDGAPGQ